MPEVDGKFLCSFTCCVWRGVFTYQHRNYHPYFTFRFNTAPNSIKLNSIVFNSVVSKVDGKFLLIPPCRSRSTCFQKHQHRKHSVSIAQRSTNPNPAFLFSSSTVLNVDGKFLCPFPRSDSDAYSLTYQHRQKTVLAVFNTAPNPIQPLPFSNENRREVPKVRGTYLSINTGRTIPIIRFNTASNPIQSSSFFNSIVSKVDEKFLLISPCCFDSAYLRINIEITEDVAHRFNIVLKSMRAFECSDVERRLEVPVPFHLLRMCVLGISLRFLYFGIVI